jgi:ataxin-3
MDLVKIIFFETQEGQLCAQHAINNLLQGSYYNAVDLAQIAQDIDSQEHMLNPLTNSVSANYDESGFFSIQVIEKAVDVWGLAISNIKSERCVIHN